MSDGISHCHNHEPHASHQWGGPDGDMYLCVGVPTQQEIDAFYDKIIAGLDVDPEVIANLPDAHWGWAMSDRKPQHCGDVEIHDAHQWGPRGAYWCLGSGTPHAHRPDLPRHPQ